MPVITISRQHGSLGDEVAEEIAERLHLRLVDQDIINEVAVRLGVSAEALSARDEREPRLVADLVRTMRRLYPATIVPRPAADHEVDESAYLQVIRQVMWELARANNAIMVGRGATYILEHGPDVLHTLFVAPLPVRIERVMASEGLNPAQATQRIQHVDTERGRYIRRFYRANWLEATHYDLVLNTGYFSQLQCVQLVESAVGGVGLAPTVADR